MGIPKHKNDLLPPWLPRLLNGLALGAVLVAAAPLPSSAADPAPDLKSLRAGLRKNLLTALVPELQNHRDELKALEQKLAAEQDFAGAARTRDARAKVEQQIAALEQEAAILASRPSTDIAARAAARIELKLAEATLTGIRLDASDGALTGWGGAGASASWKLPGLPAGGYEVLLRCSGPAGDVTVKEAFYSLTSPCKSAEQKTVEWNLGTLRVKDGSGRLTLSTTPAEKASGWRVYSVVLVPSTI